MRDQHIGPPLLRPPVDEAHEILEILGVEALTRLVDDHDLGLQEIEARVHQPLAFAARERPRRAGAEVVEAVAAQHSRRLGLRPVSRRHFAGHRARKELELRRRQHQHRPAGAGH